ncbi:variable surface protein [Plasmodium gonderi]|uniref:Variable surface protein n=1 Tax=Plasmodium gonderi TaxID=77519 RepID=A0A1Y1JPW5_PLAGO|nr:variable surface protein [Plasmodium gonderi]GAW84521.1 variable surface protein [Plasmodium gonderi]
MSVRTCLILWNEKINTSDYKCDRVKGVHSTIKSCILTQIYDFHDDQNYIINELKNKKSEISKYDDYLNEKWKRIYEYSKSNTINENIIITYLGKKQSIQSNHLPLQYNFLKDINYNTHRNSNLTVSIEKLTQSNEHNYSHTNITTSNGRNSGNNYVLEDQEIQKEHNINNKFLINKILIVMFIILGIINKCFMLYKFSHLVNWMHRKIKRMRNLQTLMRKYANDSLLSNIDKNKINIAYRSFESIHKNYI